MISNEEYAKIIEIAKEKGFDGFGGDCGPAAIALQKVIFPEGKLVAAVNQAFWDDANYIIGHIAVEVNGVFFDSDGQPKEWEDIESWGMLDFEDSDLMDQAIENFVVWNEETANEVVKIYLTEDRITDTYGFENVRSFTNLLKEAKDLVLKPQPSP